jgi:phosphoribosylglycinamide formyltransferase-1
MISGGGRTLENLASHIERGRLSAEIGLVIASSACPGAERARERGLPTLVVPGVIEPGTLARMLSDHGAAWIALAGYLKLLRIPPGFAGRAVNIHPALLPSFGGPGMYGRRVHAAVLEAGCRVSGCTVHLCDAAYDRGPILAQRACEVLDDDTPESLGARVFALECELYPRVIQSILTGRVSIEGRRARIMPA